MTLHKDDLPRLFIVTPLKDEVDNIERLVRSIECQTVKICCWLIVENDSIDGSIEVLKRLQKPDNVEHFEIINLSTNNKSYDIGFKISKVVQYGFDYLMSNFDLKQGDFISLLDADSFPESKYYKYLIEKLEPDNMLGLASGVLRLENGKRDNHNNFVVRGSGRVWRYDCFKDYGKFYGLSADSITQRQAELGGWKTKLFTDVHFVSREENVRVSYTFRGRSAYYNGYNLKFVLIKSFYLLFTRPWMSFPYFWGYVKAWGKGDAKNPDKKILEYNSHHLKRVIHRKIFKENKQIINS